MWDFLKKAAGVALERGADYLVQSAAVQNILNADDFDSGLAALRDHIYSLEHQASFNTFLIVVRNRHQQALQGVEQARHDEAGSWGNTIEDRIARSMAHIKAGIPQGQSAAVQEAQRYVEIMEAMDRYARQFWQEAQSNREAARLTVQPAAPEPEPARPMEQRAAAAHHIDRIASMANSGPAIAYPETGPLTELQALSLQIEADGRLTRLMMKTMPGQAGEETVIELDETHDMYARLLRDAPAGSTLVTKDVITTSMARAREFAGNACDSLREEARALAYYEQALPLVEAGGNTTDIEKLKRKIAVLQENLSGDIDAAIARLSVPQDNLFDEIDRLLDLAAVVNQGGDTFRALDLLHQAETMLDDNGITPPSPEELANSIADSFAGITSGTVRADQSAIQRSVKIRTIYQSLYSMLARAYAATDPDDPDFEADLAKSDAYHKKWQDLDNQSDNDAFSAMMRRFLDEGKFG